jgi:hypothetical protein
MLKFLLAGRFIGEGMRIGNGVVIYVNTTVVESLKETQFQRTKLFPLGGGAG